MKIVSLLAAVFQLLLIHTGAAAQPQTAKGMVQNENREPLIGAAVYVKGTSNGVSTGIDGRFSLPNVTVGDTLVFSYMQVTKQIAFQGEKELTVTLEEYKTLEEVVVVGYGQM